MGQVFGLLIGVLLIPVVWAQNDFIVVTLKDEATINTVQYRLTDVADISGVRSTPQFGKEWLGKTPRPGQLSLLTRFELEARLERNWPGISKQLRINGAKTVTVRGGGVSYDTALLEPIAKTHLKNWVSNKYRALDNVVVEVSRVGKEETLLLPKGEIKLHPRQSDAANVRKRMVVWVDIQVDGETFQTVPVWFSVSVTLPVRVAKAKLEKYHLLSSSDWEWKQMDVAGMDGTPVFGEIGPDVWLLREIADATVLTKEDLGVRPQVREGQQITVIANHGRVAIATKGVALGNGKTSERIRVENPSSGESYSARVIGEGIARVQ